MRRAGDPMACRRRRAHRARRLGAPPAASSAGASSVRGSAGVRPDDRGQRRVEQRGVARHEAGGVERRGEGDAAGPADPARASSSTHTRRRRRRGSGSSRRCRWRRRAEPCRRRPPRPIHRSIRQRCGRGPTGCGSILASACWVVIPQPNSWERVVPTTTAPARRSAATTAASAVARRPASTSDPYVTSVPATSNSSFTPMGTPCRALRG